MGAVSSKLKNIWSNKFTMRHAEMMAEFLEEVDRSKRLCLGRAWKESDEFHGAWLKETNFHIDTPFHGTHPYVKPSLGIKRKTDRVCAVGFAWLRD